MEYAVAGDPWFLVLVIKVVIGDGHELHNVVFLN